ncbi:MAG: MFS transporter [Pseudonocardia sp.]|nr:MFS transporter [Pseudonocardia sp.]
MSPGPDRKPDARVAASVAGVEDETSAELRSSYRRAFAASALGWALDGFDFTMFAFALPAILTSLGISVAVGGTVTTLALMASALGGVVGGVLADRFGRVRVLIWVIFAFALFTGLTATAQNLAQLTLWHTLEGFAFGAEWPVGAALLAEYARSEHRGRSMAWLQSAYSFGWALSTLCYYLLFGALPGDVAWRALFLVGIVPALVALVIRRTVRDRVVATYGSRRGPRLRRIFAGRLRRTTIISTLLLVGGQGAYYTVFGFLPLYLRDDRHLSIASTATYLWVVIVGGFLGYVSSGYLHDLLGRRPTFTLYYLGIAVAVLLFVLAPIGTAAGGYAVVFMLGFTLSGSAGGLGAFLAELFPTELRGSGVGFAYNVGRGIGALGPLAVGAAAHALALGGAILTVTLVVDGIALVAVWCLPETRGKVILSASVPSRPPSSA